MGVCEKMSKESSGCRTRALQHKQRKELGRPTVYQRSPAYSLAPVTWNPEFASLVVPEPRVFMKEDFWEMTWVEIEVW